MVDVGKIQGSSSQTVLSTGNKKANISWSEYTTEQKKEKFKDYLDVGFKCIVIPSGFVAGISSAITFFKTNILGQDDDFWDRNASIANRSTYFFNGVYGGLRNVLDNCLPGALGYSLVSASSFFPNHLMYFIKGFGTIFDQLPAFLKDVAHNDRVVDKYKKDKVNTFNIYDTLTQSVAKTKESTIIVYQDIIKDYKENRAQGKGFIRSIITPLTAEFTSGKKTGEKNLIVSSTGVLGGVLIGTLSGLKGFGLSIGSSIRDLFGMHADFALFKKGWSNTKEGVATGLGNALYMICGGLYTLGSLTDLTYRWTGLNKLETLALGLDNLGFLFMTWANAWDIDEESNKNGNGNHTAQPPPPEPALATAAG